MCLSAGGGAEESVSAVTVTIGMSFLTEDVFTQKTGKISSAVTQKYSAFAVVHIIVPVGSPMNYEL